MTARIVDFRTFRRAARNRYRDGCGAGGRFCSGERGVAASLDEEWERDSELPPQRASVCDGSRSLGEQLCDTAGCGPDAASVIIAPP
jgi:hypothetical protein